MHTTRFCDLRFQLGAAYLYCHQVLFCVASCNYAFKRVSLFLLYLHPLLCLILWLHNWNLDANSIAIILKFVVNLLDILCFVCFKVYVLGLLQGDCKHTIVIRDMRLIHQEDVQNQAAYPIVIFQLKPRTQKCSVCRIYRAKKVAVDDKWAQENPCYFCDYCYSLLHSGDGISPYENCSVYDYIHD